MIEFASDITPAAPEIRDEADGAGTWSASGCWTLAQTDAIEGLLGKLKGAGHSLDASAIERLDTAGALMLLDAARRLGIGGEQLRLSRDHEKLVEAVRRIDEKEAPEAPLREPGWRHLLAHIGLAMETILRKLRDLIAFFGLALTALIRTLFHPARLRLTATVHHMEQSGLDAVPLVVVLSFLVGAVLAFLGATVLRDFGAELFVVELVSYAFLREFGTLLTAILLAGRTASAFTAQIGTMKGREEIDAIRTMGLDVIDLLVVPRVLALLVMLPILAFLAMIAGMAGGMTVASVNLGIPVGLFITRLHETIELQHFLVGMSKAPVFAMVIALVGCLEGFKVVGTAQSVGERTTSSVVQCIALVIVINALAAVFFLEVGL